MKIYPLFKSAAIASTVLVWTCSSKGDTTVGVDPSAGWIGYMNVFNLPADGGAYQFGSSWGTSDLQAAFNSSVITLSPCTNVWETTDTYWVKADGVSPNKNMDANFYVQNDALSGQTVTFQGDVLSDSLVSPYTSVAFIKDYNASYSLVGTTTFDLSQGGSFSISLPTIAGDHIQYGFETIGPDANPATAASLGFVQIGPVPEPSSLTLAGLGGAVIFGWLRRRNN